MLCSVPTRKSSSNWLERLRSTKGFPAADNLDLDNFLTNSSNSTSESTDKRVTADQTQIPNCSSENQENEWLGGVVTNVLCDLFNMGGIEHQNSRFSGKKNARKQTNPKFFDVSTPSTVVFRKEEYVQQEPTSTSFHSDNNSNVVGDCYVDDDDNIDDEKEKCSSGGGSGGGSSDKELKGYSKSEVTVIDTSFEVWKFDKLVFRRKNIWKVRDKKGKSWNFCSKKRKGNHLDSTSGNGNGNGNVGCKKKAKFSNSEFTCSKDSSGEDFALPSNDDQKIQDEKREESCKDTFDEQFKIPKKRIHFPRSPRKSKKNGSSVILIKAIPTTKKCGRNLPRNRLKDVQRQ